MSNIQILDCTLRDGGYCNEWRFGLINATKISAGLIDANVEIIECGFITNKVAYDPEATKFATVEQIKSVIPEDREGKKFVAMINYGEYDIEDIPPYDGSSIDGIRVAFHKKNLVESLEFCRQIKAKGYLVFIQAMVSLSYSDDEFLSMIRTVNEFEPYAFYIVDSFGMMKGKDLTRLFYMIEHNLKENVWIGLHCHNNLQLAYSNAQRLATVQTNRNLIIDSAIMGMGRGAGNLNTELFVDYLNETAGGNYNIRPLLAIIDEIINEFYQRNPWGYSLPNYLSASHNAHPSYAGYLDDKKTLTIEAMDEIFSMMDEEKRFSYDQIYIEELYLRYMARGRVQDKHKTELSDRLESKKVLLIAPGKSSADEKEKICAFAENDDVISISVNFDYPGADYIFLSNLRRYRELDADKRAKCIVTSNIPADNVYLQTCYQDLLNNEEAVKDNAGLMAVKLLMDYGVKEIYLAGFDGYSYDVNENYSDSHMAFIAKSAVLNAMNEGMKKILSCYAQDINIVFLTKKKYIWV